MTLTRKNRLIKIAKSLQSKQNGRTFHVSFILKNNQILSIGTNDYSKRHLEKRFGKYVPTKIDTTHYIPSIHSEISVIRNFINTYRSSDFSDLTLYNTRLGFDGEPMLAKPCANCERLLKSFSFKRILWS